MRGNRRTDTTPETALRTALHANGRRFRKDYRVTSAAGISVRVDIVFRRLQVAIFVDGCFWHGCPDHCRVPTRNRAYWLAKIERNRVRDEHVAAALIADGWQVVRIWEHEPVEDAVDRVEAALSG